MTRRARAAAVALAALLVLLLTVVWIATHSATEREAAGPAPGQAGSTDPSPPTSGPGTPSSGSRPVRMTSLPRGGIDVAFEPGSLVAYPRSGDGFLDPVTDRDGHLLLPRRAPKGAIRDNIVVYELDGRDRVSDILTVSNSRGHRRVLMPLQTVVSPNGVEFHWNARGRTDWTVERDGTELASDLTGSYVDPDLPARPAYYVVQSEPPGGVDAERGPVYLVTVLEQPSSNLLGAPAATLRTDG